MTQGQPVMREPEPEPEPEPSPSHSPRDRSGRPGFSKVGKGGNGSKDKKSKKDKGPVSVANAFSLLGPESSDSGDSDSDFESVNGDTDSDDDGRNGSRERDDDPPVKDTSEQLKFMVPRGDLGLLRGYGDQNLKRAEERSGVYSISVESNGQVVMRGESQGALEAAKQSLKVVEETLEVSKQQFDAYVRRFRTDSAKARRIDEIWKETSARVSWEKESRKSRKAPNAGGGAQNCQFSIMGPQVALDIAIEALQEELEEALAQAPPQPPPPPTQKQDPPNRNSRNGGGGGKGGKQQQQQQQQQEEDGGLEAPVEPKRGPPEAAAAATEPALPPLPEGVWEKIRLPCDERWDAVLASEKLLAEGGSVDTEAAVPTVVVARIARRVFPTLRNTEAVTTAYRTVASDAAGMVKASDLKRMIHNLVFINNHWPAVHALKHNCGYDMDLTTFRGSWQSFSLIRASAVGVAVDGVSAVNKESLLKAADGITDESAGEADAVFACLMDDRFTAITAKIAAQQDTTGDPEGEDAAAAPAAEPPAITERPTRASIDEFISALAMRFADQEDKDGGFIADLEEKLALAAELKIAGNESYKGENWSEAIDNYTRALDAIKACEAETAQTDLVAVLLSNRAAARGLADRCMDALSDCERCVELAPSYMRGVKRRADCHAALGVWDKSIQDFKTVVESCVPAAAPAADADADADADASDPVAETGADDAAAPAAPAAVPVDEQTAKLLLQAEAGLKSVEKVRHLKSFPTPLLPY